MFQKQNIRKKNKNKNNCTDKHFYTDLNKLSCLQKNVHFTIILLKSLKIT